MQRRLLPRYSTKDSNPTSVRRSIERQDNDTSMDQTVAPQSTLTFRVQCADGHQVDWTKGRKHWLCTRDMHRCMAIVVMNKERGFLQHLTISDIRRTEEQIMNFQHFWKLDSTHYADAKFFYIRPRVTGHPGDLVNINRVISKFHETIGMIDREGRKRDIRAVEVLTADGEYPIDVGVDYGWSAPDMLAVFVNGVQVFPPVPAFHETVGPSGSVRRFEERMRHEERMRQEERRRQEDAACRELHRPTHAESSTTQVKAPHRSTRPESSPMQVKVLLEAELLNPRSTRPEGSPMQVNALLEAANF